MTTSPAGSRARDRAPDEAPVVVRLLAHVPPWARRGGIAVAAGRLLLLLSGAVIVVGALCLGLDDHELRILAGVSAAMLAVVGVSVLVPWRAGSWATLLFPLALLAGVGVLGVSTTEVATAFVGLVPLAFVYTGLFHPGRAAVALLPAAWAAYLCLFPVLDGSAVVRLAINAVTWWGIAQVLAVTVGYQRALRRRLRTDARTDVLTSLANRRDLDERLAETVAGDCVVIADLDHFKCVNDTQGHVAGDSVLERFGHVLDEHLRRRDYAARYGGEEFVLILPRTEPTQAVSMLRALRAEWAEEGTGVTFSAGVALVTADTPPGSALAAADVALYRAKQAGRDRFRIATDALASRPPRPAGPAAPEDAASSADHPASDVCAGC